MDPKSTSSSTNQPADFEKAVSETGYGLFNIILLLVAIPSCAATVYETSTISYVLPAAECDLRLSLIEKGVLNAVTYAGMITSAVMWGFLADTWGRRKLLVYGLLLDGICAMFASLSQNIYSLLIFKYLGGFIVCGPFAVLMSYMTEFHGTNNRSIVVMAIGMFFSIANITLPLLAWAVLPRDWNFSFFNNYLVIHTWQIFMGVSSIPGILSSIFITFLPESPKFLMSKGRNAEALEVFRLMFSLNTLKNKTEYPIKALVEEVEQVNEQRAFTINYVGSIVDITRIQKNPNDINSKCYHAYQEWKPMFHKPYLGQALHVYTIQFCILLGLNTFRLWLPQLFASIARFEENDMHLDESADICSMIEYNVNYTKTYLNKNSTDICNVKISDKMYINTIIVGFTQLTGYLVAGGLINALGNKRILIIAMSIAGTCGISLYWAKNSLTTLILFAIYVGVSSVGSTSLVGVIVNLFPTSMRTMVVSLAMMFGRLGALIGNLLFPLFMQIGCLPPFLMVGSVMLVAGGLCLLLPITHKLALK